MCGIVGCLNIINPEKRLIEGLYRLEYRGYDSSGLFLMDQSKSYNEKSLGRVQDLELKIDLKESFNMGIAHTRWATHGKVTLENAHPHISHDQRFIGVHNGVIDNYKQLENDYLSDILKNTETDTETVLNLLTHFVQKMDYEKAIQKTLSLLKGSYALVIIDQLNPTQMIIAKNKSPLIIGKKAKEIMLASDVLALAGFVDQIHVMNDKTFAILSSEEIKAYDSNINPINFDFEDFKIDPVISTRGDYPHYMLKEIFEQPEVIKRLITHSTHQGLDPQLKELFKGITSVEIIAAGTSYHAGLYSKTLIENSLNVSAHVHVGSEFAYYPPKISENPLFVFISQSGETADLISCLPTIKKTNGKIITLTNVMTSRLAKEADLAIDLMAGPEIAVASTKAFTAQITMISLIIDYLRSDSGFTHGLSNLAIEMERLLQVGDSIKTHMQWLLTKRNAFFIGRGLDYAIALEASLKLKEISYIQSEAFPAGELKHGTIALIEEDTPVIALLTEEKTASLTRANVEELEARGASTFIVSLDSIAQDGDDIIVKTIHPLLNSLLSVIPLQLVAYYAALHRGHDIDKPRNLAKSVTVE